MFSYETKEKNSLVLTKLKMKGIQSYKGYLRVSPQNAPFGVFGL